jgi:hypothetical protein
MVSMRQVGTEHTKKLNVAVLNKSDGRGRMLCVPVRKSGGGNESVVLDADSVVLLVLVFDAAKDGDTVRD